MSAVRGLAGPALVCCLLVASGPALAHAGQALEVVARDGADCGGTDICLELFSVPADLEPGHDTALELRNHANASEAYAAALAPLDRADPNRTDTPASAALATTPAVQPGQRAQANFTVPEASALYVWLSGDDHEARGGRETVPLDAGAPPDRGPGARPAPGPGAALAAALAAMGALAARTRS